MYKIAISCVTEFLNILEPYGGVHMPQSKLLPCRQKKIRILHSYLDCDLCCRTIFIQTFEPL